MQKKSSLDRLPPHSIEAEQGVIGCCLLSPQIVLEACKGVRPNHFYDLRHQELWKVMRQMAEKRVVIDIVTLNEELKKRKLLEQIGGLTYVATLPDSVPSAANIQYYLEIVREKFALRETLRACGSVLTKVDEWEGGTAEFLAGVQSDLDIVGSLLRGEDSKNVLTIRTVKELLDYKPPVGQDIIGTGEIQMGSVVLIAGPGSAGKSLCVDNLSLAAAKGCGTWMGRPVHRKFKILIIQAENGEGRLSKAVKTMKKNHPNLEIENHVFISTPPEGGIPFHKSEFRARMREEIARIKPDVVVIDPWSQVAADAEAKDVVDKINEIRSTFPSGDERPCLVIVAHVNKPRPDQVRSGRSMMYMVSGSIALVNTSRCTYMLLPWTEDTTDDRILWCTPKLNDAEGYSPTVWHRRFADFFEQDHETDWRKWGKDENQEDKYEALAAVVRQIFEDKKCSVMSKTALAKALGEKTNPPVAYPTAMKYFNAGPQGHLAHLFTVTKEGWLMIKES